MWVLTDGQTDSLTNSLNAWLSAAPTLPLSGQHHSSLWAPGKIYRVYM